MVGTLNYLKGGKNLGNKCKNYNLVLSRQCNVITARRRLNGHRFVEDFRNCARDSSALNPRWLSGVKGTVRRAMHNGAFTRFRTLPVSCHSVLWWHLADLTTGDTHQCARDVDNRPVTRVVYLADPLHQCEALFIFFNLSVPLIFSDFVCSILRIYPRTE